MRAISVAVLFLVSCLVCHPAQCQHIPTFANPIEHSDWILRQLGQDSPTRPAADSKAHTMVEDYGLRLQGRPQILLFGDSITALGFLDAPEGSNLGYTKDYRGWAVLLNETLQNQAHVQNLAFVAGKNTRGLKGALHQLIEQLKPIAHEVVLVNLEFGANDAILGQGCDSGWYSSVDAYTAVLRDSVTRMRDVGINNIILTTPPPTGFRHKTNPDRLNCFTELYARALLNTLGPELGLPVANTFDALMAVPDWQKTALAGDGLHLSPLGNQVMHKVFVEAAVQRYPHITATGLSSWFRQKAAMIARQPATTSGVVTPAADRS